MNNKEIIIEEVQRILQIMEVSEKTTPLLNEGIIDDVIQGIVKVGTKSGDDALVVISKLEREFGIPKGVLDSDDVFDLIKGTSDEQIAVLSKIINKMGPKQVDDLAQKVWSQLSETHIQMDNIVRSIKDSNTKISPKYIDDMADATIKSKEPGFDPLIESLKSQFKKRMNDSLKGYIDVAGSSSKVPTSRFKQSTTTPSSPTTSYDNYVKGMDKEFDIMYEQALMESPYKLATEQDDSLRNVMHIMYKNNVSIDVNDFFRQVNERLTNMKGAADVASEAKMSWIKKTLSKLRSMCGVKTITWKTLFTAPGCMVGFIGIASAVSFGADFFGLDNRLWKKLPCAMLAFIDIPDFWAISDSEFYKDLCSGQEWWKSGDGGYTNNEESLKKWASDNGITIEEIIWGEEYSEINEELYEFIDGSTGWVAV
jgi:hypothetical protein